MQEILAQYPFKIPGFHCDNGAEHINHRVAEMLNKLLAEFTKSRPRRSTGNALVEGKSGAVVRNTCNERGKRRRRYKVEDYRTPYEKLTSVAK